MRIEECVDAMRRECRRKDFLMFGKDENMGRERGKRRQVQRVAFVLKVAVAMQRTWQAVALADGHVT